MPADEIIMLEIKQASPEQADAISRVTREAFKIYKDALHSEKDVRLSALTETAEDVLNDIKKHTVLAAAEDGRVIGAIRVEKLSAELAYIYRFAVDPAETSGGVGSGLLAAAVKLCAEKGFSAIALHTNSKYYKLARYYYGKKFYVHSTSLEKGYIRALFVKELTDKIVDLSPAYKK